jgi:hypothetical protein
MPRNAAEGLIAMPSGGARTRSGPAPDPNALRRDRDAGEWVTLPAEGRTTDPPMWPLVNPSGRELALWRLLWEKPQAVQWERNGQELEVALYVRNLTVVEQPGSPVNAGTLLRQQSESLGLTTLGLRANRWRIGGTSAAAPAGSKDAAAPKRSSARSRLTVVPHGDVA